MPQQRDRAALRTGSRGRRAGVAGAVPVAGTFAERTFLDGGLEAIPTPGHTPGSTCYLWDSGEHRFLFTGDSLWVEDGVWKAVVLDPDSRADYLGSPAALREVDFDVVVPWGVGETDAAGSRKRIDAIISRVRDGGNRWPSAHDGRKRGVLRKARGNVVPVM